MGMTKNDLETTPTGSAERDLQVELEETQRALRDVILKIEQSQGELSKLTQRNAAISTHLQWAQTKIDELPPAELRMAYDSALAFSVYARPVGKIAERQNSSGKIEGGLGAPFFTR
jgi:chromosome segregation ATPase